MTKKPKLADYWSTDILKSIPWFSSAVFSRNRFEAIFHTRMHASEVDAAGKAKIEPFVDRLVSNFQRAFYPYKNLSIHEMVIGSKGRFAAKQYNPNKPEKHHIKKRLLGYVILRQDIVTIYSSSLVLTHPTTPTQTPMPRRR